MSRILSVVSGCLFYWFSLLSCADNIQLVDESHHWQTKVVAARQLPMVDNIVFHPDGTLYATLEKWFNGKLVRIGPGDRVTVLISRLNRADGLLLHNDKLYVTEEVKKGRILEYDIKSKRTTVLLRNVRKPEGIDRFANGDLVIAEDSYNASIILLDQNRRTRVLISKLSRPEGICVDAGQALYIAETGKNRVLKYDKGKLTVVLDKIVREPDQVECHEDGSLWISEDKNPGRVFRLQGNKLSIVAKGLSSPQGIAFGRNGEVYIAEQHKHRIIKLVPKFR